ncbi:MAG TPA: hypothetical protein VJ725_24230 [Thermoanaerobaculia bacterium]|nr:hypothetical protein [Thermoanaerobaculia bacterium]
MLVSPVPGNPTASGTALQTALAGISSPSSTNQWLLKLEPGIYDVGSTLLQMRSWVDIEGSGIGVTTITGSVPVASNFDATVHGADNAELRLLTVEATAGTTSSAIAMANYNVSPRIYRVRFSTAAGTAWGVRNVNSATLMEEVEITATATGAGDGYGVIYRGFPNQKGAVRRSKITVTGAANNYGLFLASSLCLDELRDSRIDVTGGVRSRGLYADASGWSTSGENLRVKNTEINAAGGSTASYGMDLSTANLGLEVTESKVWGTGSGSTSTYGIVHNSLLDPLIVQSSWVIGFTNSISGNLAPSVTGTTLQGGPVSPAALTGLNQEFDVMGHGDVGIGTGAPTEKLHVFEDENANSLLLVENPNTGASAAGVLRAKSDTAYSSLIAHGSGRTVSRFGQTLGSWNELLQVGGNGLILGTLNAYPLILGTGSVNRFHITGTGSIGVGTSTPSSLFHVNGGDIRVSGGSFIDDGVTLNAPDYVFEPDYSLKSLGELREFIDREKHLPNIPSAAEIKANGLKLGQFQMLLLEKVEELTLYTLDQDEEIRKLRAEKAELETQLGERLSALERAVGVQNGGSPQ